MDFRLFQFLLAVRVPHDSVLHKTDQASFFIGNDAGDLVRPEQVGLHFRDHLRFPVPAIDLIQLPIG